jgi:hypothetical protein
MKKNINEVRKDATQGAFITKADKYEPSQIAIYGDYFNQKNAYPVARCGAVSVKENVITATLLCHEHNTHQMLLDALCVVCNRLGEYLDAADDQFGRELDEAYQHGYKAIEAAEWVEVKE